MSYKSIYHGMKHSWRQILTLLDLEGLEAELEGDSDEELEELEQDPDEDGHRREEWMVASAAGPNGIAPGMTIELGTRDIDILNDWTSAYYAIWPILVNI